VVIGPSGSGKSTFLRCLNLLETPTEGEIFIDDEKINDPKVDVNRIRQKMGMVFQHFNLFGHMTSIENIMFGPVKLLGKTKQEAYDEGMRLLGMVGLSEKAMNYPDELSGGQKQRIAIARTLAMNPEIILLDEPTSALDPSMVGEVQSVIRDLVQNGKTMMIVTHEMNFARSICNRVFYMDEGGIYEDGSPDQIFENPQKEKTRRFIRRLKVQGLEIRSKTYDYLSMQGLISEYCAKNRISSRTEKRLQLLFEEAVQQMLIPALEQPDIRMTIEYSEETGKVKTVIRYGGGPFDITQSEDELSLLVLKSTAEQIHYEWKEGDQRGNRLTAVIRS
jgi:polar amino acid transport system ATP-binding protein